MMMAGEKVSVGIDDIVASATTGVLRALEARKIGTERLTAADLVRSGFIVRFEIWAGGIWGDWNGPGIPGRGPTGPGGP
jgi:hypothetical protein